MALEYTDPPVFLYDPDTVFIYVMDDFGNAVRVPSSMWYASHPSLN